MAEIGPVTAVNPNCIEEYTDIIKKWLAQRREISQNLSTLDEQFKELKGKTTFLYEEDKALDSELEQLKEEIGEIQKKVQGTEEALKNQKQ